jgi:hypothetical protein
MAISCRVAQPRNSDLAANGLEAQVQVDGPQLF